MAATAPNALEAAANGTTTDEKAGQIYDTVKSWGFKETVIEEGRTGIPLTRQMQAQGGLDDYKEFLEERYGTKHPFLLGTAAGFGGESTDAGRAEKRVRAESKAVDEMMEKAVVDSSTVQAASPIVVDPAIVDIQINEAQVLTRVPTEVQAGFTAKYNIISDRSDPIGFITETDALDLSENSDGDFTLETAEQAMKIWVDKVNISDFAQRAESTLGYMDLTNTTMGQRAAEHFRHKASAFFYADPSSDATGSAVGGLESTEAYPGMARLAVDAGNNTDKSAFSGSGDTPLLEDLKAEITNLVSTTGTTYGDLEVFVSPDMYDALENEANPVVRLDSYDDDINFGARGLRVKGVPIVECNNVGNSAYVSGGNTAFSPADGDVFIADVSRGVRYRALQPLSTVPLGRVGLSDRAAMFEYGSLIDKSHGNFLRYLSGYPLS